MGDTPAARCCIATTAGGVIGAEAMACVAARDAVKKEVLRKAGIGYHEIVAGHAMPSELRALVQRLVPSD